VPKKKKKGFLSLLGIEAEKAPSTDEKAKAERQAKVVLAWQYLRDRIDRGVLEYLQSGDSQIIRDHVAQPVQGKMIDHLDRLRANGLVLQQPDRSTRTKPRFEVVSEQLNAKGMPTSFVIRENFTDFSVLQATNGQESSAGGRDRAIQAKVEVEDGQHFRLLEIIEVKGATI
jgi:hypothetical protein